MKLMLKIKYNFYILLILSIVSFPTKSFTDNHNLKEVIELIQKDLKTLERAVYSENFSSDSATNSVSVIDQNSEEVFFCGCKKSKNPPFCDGSHKSLKYTEDFNIFYLGHLPIGKLNKVDDSAVVESLSRLDLMKYKIN